jgi:hypothetical protein
MFDKVLRAGEGKKVRALQALVPDIGAFEPEISDPESLELQWVPVERVGDKELHPGFGAAWPGLRRRLLGLDAGTD